MAGFLLCDCEAPRGANRCDNNTTPQPSWRNRPPSTTQAERTNTPYGLDLIRVTDEQEQDPILRQAERALGRRLTPAELAPIGTLNDVSEEARAITAALPGLLRIWFLQKLVDESERDDIRDYLEHVVDGGVPAERWRRGGILLADFGLPDMLQRETADILGVIPIDGGTWRRRPVSREAWERHAGFVGAPAVERPDLDRRFQPPRHVMRFHTPGRVFEREDMPERRARRWIAARIARATRRFQRRRWRAIRWAWSAPCSRTSGRSVSMRPSR
jgi:hypothetical protein